MNPVEAFLGTKEAAMQDKRTWETNQLALWKQTKDPEHLQPLIQSYAPVIANKVRQFKAPTVNEAAFKAELHKHLIGAFETFDPDRGAMLSTHVENRLRKAQRYNAKYQNVAYIPEGQASHIGRINRATNELTEQFGRPPTHEEIGDHIGIKPSLVAKVIGSQRKDVRASSFDSDPTEIAMHRDQEVLDLLPYNLSPDENAVFNHIFGKNGAMKTDSTNVIAQKLGKSPSQVSRLRTSILARYKQYEWQVRVNQADEAAQLGRLSVFLAVHTAKSLRDKNFDGPRPSWARPTRQEFHEHQLRRDGSQPHGPREPSPLQPDAFAHRAGHRAAGPARRTGGQHGHPRQARGTGGHVLLHRGW